QGRADASDDAIEDLQTRNVELREKNATLEGKVSNHEKQIEDLMQMVVTLSNRVERLENQ
ncbi:MAG: hypothetical protein J6Y59_09750, partial [Bacteroidaceae bacterium]|nr:hypothetical protein [Bacteroidaceae bacterium]